MPRVAGFFGFGRIARATLVRLRAFGVTRCIYVARHTASDEAALAATHGLTEVRHVDRDALARESDVVFVLAPGGAATHHAIDEHFLRAMKRTSILVNTSRGSLVDSDALALALHEGWIWGAALDVVEGEPKIAADHPLVREPR